MNPISQLDCLLTKGSLTQEARDNLVSIISGTQGLASTDILALIFAALVTGSTTTPTASELIVLKTANYTAVNGNKILADTSLGAFSVTLPEEPEVGYTINVYDAKATFDTNNLTILRNGELINSLADDLVCDVDKTYIELVFVGGAVGWQIYIL